MCMLTFFPEGVLPDVEALENGSYMNDDGHGFAIVHNDQLIVRHGMDADNMIAKFKSLRAAMPDGPALFHSRLGTGGSVSRRNCHPFHVGDDRMTVVAHNGILPASAQPFKQDWRSDTHYAAEEILPTKFGNIGSKRWRKRLTRWLGDNNKLVFLTVNPNYWDNAYILNEKKGLWDDGIWYSNLDYRYPGYRTYTHTGNTGTTEDTGAAESLWESSTKLFTCEQCLFPTLDIRSGFCLKCGACADCGSPEGYCECYLPPEIERDMQRWWNAQHPEALAAATGDVET